ncbi:MAG: FkbM family methyltransferase, partial [Prevotellaceae bacterium]|nr:FkbM family methyltransferase [Prevotellaceae bacterium]
MLYSKILKGLREQTTLKGGIRFQLDIEDWIPSCLYFSGEYEAGEIDFMQNSLSEGDVLIDIGANIGLYTLYGAKAVGKSGSVFAFEPFSLNYDNLIKNISINHFSNIIVEKKAVSDNSTPINIYYDKNEKNSGMASSYLTEYSHEEQVESITLDQYLEDKSLNKINFIKID